MATEPMYFQMIGYVRSLAEDFATVKETDTRQPHAANSECVLWRVLSSVHMDD